MAKREAVRSRPNIMDTINSFISKCRPLLENPALTATFFSISHPEDRMAVGGFLVGE